MTDSRVSNHPVSPAAALAWKIAMLEALLAGSEFIEKEHLFIGICSLEKLLSVKDLLQDNPVSRAILYERDAIDFSLKQAKVEATGLRRGVRRLIRRTERRDQRKVIHRSPDCRTYFTRAAELSGTGVITSIHLLGAILEKPGPVIGSILEPGWVQNGAQALPPAGSVVIRSLREFGEAKKEEQQIRSGIIRSRHALASISPESDHSIRLRNQLRTKTLRVARLCLTLGDLAGVASALKELAGPPDAADPGISSLCAQLLFLHAEGISLGSASLHHIGALLAELEAAAGREG